MTKEEIASKEACRILREHFIGLGHPNIDAYDDTYVINNYPFEWSLYMDGWKSENERLKAESRLIINEILKVVDDGIQTSAIIAIANKFNIKL